MYIYSIKYLIVVYVASTWNRTRERGVSFSSCGGYLCYFKDSEANSVGAVRVCSFLLMTMISAIIFATLPA